MNHLKMQNSNNARCAKAILFATLQTGEGSSAVISWQQGAMSPDNTRKHPKRGIASVVLHSTSRRSQAGRAINRDGSITAAAQAIPTTAHLL
jgi:hypothetical protein